MKLYKDGSDWIEREEYGSSHLDSAEDTPEGIEITAITAGPDANYDTTVLLPWGVIDRLLAAARDRRP